MTLYKNKTSKLFDLFHWEDVIHCTNQTLHTKEGAAALAKLAYVFSFVSFNDKIK